MNFWEKKKKEILEAPITDLIKGRLIYKVTPDEEIKFSKQPETVQEMEADNLYLFRAKLVPREDFVEEI